MKTTHNPLPATNVDLRRALVRQLQSAQLLPRSENLPAVDEKVLMAGTAERQRLVDLVGQAAWKDLLHQMRRSVPEKDCIRVLGFGYELTRFVVAPLNVPRGELSSVASLGAQANFIVALFDRLADHGTAVTTLLPATALESAVADSKVGIKPNSNSTSPFMEMLVQDYFARLVRLPYSRRHHALLQHIKRLVLEMYRVELDALNLNPASLSTSNLRKKNALPFVIIGLPGWLTCAELPRQRQRWHSSWLFRLGVFFGWIDDAADLDDDVVSGQPNQILLSGERGRLADYATVARMVARQGQNVLREWRKEASRNGIYPGESEDAFKACIASWLGLSTSEICGSQQVSYHGAWV